MNRVVALAVLVLTMFGAVGHAAANVVINIDKSSQRMSVSVDGVPRYDFVVSTGRAGYGTPNGVFHPVRLAVKWFSKKYYDSPMPHSIFFRGGYAIHGSYEISRLGGPASHGCVRLHPADAAKLFALVRDEGMRRTTIVVTGRNPRTTRPAVQEARRPAVRPSYRRSYGTRYGDQGPTYRWQPYRADPYAARQYYYYYGGWTPYPGSGDD